MADRYEHYATASSFSIECRCGRVISEQTEAKARDRFEMHRTVEHDRQRTEHNAHSSDGS